MTETRPAMDARFHPASAQDYVPAPLLRALQLERLQSIVRRAYDKVELFRTRMQGRGLQPEDVRALEDISRLPFTVKIDLRDTYPFGLFASPMQEVVRLHASSGTTGKPIVVAYTQEDVDVWTNAMVRTLVVLRAEQGRHRPERLRLRAVHRRPRLPLRRRGTRAPRSSPSREATPTGRS